MHFVLSLLLISPQLLLVLLLYYVQRVGCILSSKRFKFIFTLLCSTLRYITLHIIAQCRLVGLVLKGSSSRAEDQGFDSRRRSGDFSESSHTSDLKIGTPVATLPDAWSCKVSTGTG